MRAYLGFKAAINFLQKNRENELFLLFGPSLFAVFTPYFSVHSLEFLCVPGLIIIVNFSCLLGAEFVKFIQYHVV